MASKDTRQPSPGLTKADRETLTPTQQITLRGFYADASLARFRAEKHRKAGKHLQADIQDDIASGHDLEALRYRQSIARMSDDDLEPNASAAYYVWVLRQGSDEPLSSEGPYGPMGLKVAEQNARIGASKGVHDRAVSRGRDPESLSFRIERRYQAKSGRRLI